MEKHAQEPVLPDDLLEAIAAWRKLPTDLQDRIIWDLRMMLHNAQELEHQYHVGKITRTNADTLDWWSNQRRMLEVTVDLLRKLKL